MIIQGLPGLGKTTLRNSYPSLYYDGDDALDDLARKGVVSAHNDILHTISTGEFTESFCYYTDQIRVHLAQGKTCFVVYDVQNWFCGENYLRVGSMNYGKRIHSSDRDDLKHWSVEELDEMSLTLPSAVFLRENEYISHVVNKEVNIGS